MIIPEQEALERWCPHARSFFAVQIQGKWVEAVANRDKPDGMIPACIGSKCMAWRWHSAKKIKELDIVSLDVVDQGPRLGYCGLSGKPDHE